MVNPFWVICVNSWIDSHFARWSCCNAMSATQQIVQCVKKISQNREKRQNVAISKRRSYPPERARNFQNFKISKSRSYPSEAEKNFKISKFLKNALTFKLNQIRRCDGRQFHHRQPVRLSLSMKATRTASHPCLSSTSR